jgi:hypothetical protein
MASMALRNGTQHGGPASAAAGTLLTPHAVKVLKGWKSVQECGRLLEDGVSIEDAAGRMGVKPDTVECYRRMLKHPEAYLRLSKEKNARQKQMEQAKALSALEEEVREAMMEGGVYVSRYRTGPHGFSHLRTVASLMKEGNKRMRAVEFLDGRDLLGRLFNRFVIYESRASAAPRLVELIGTPSGRTMHGESCSIRGKMNFSRILNIAFAGDPKTCEMVKRELGFSLRH